jgi:endonuclease YncB( thermonuclease family)
MMRRAVTGVIVGVALLASAGGQAVQVVERPSWKSKPERLVVRVVDGDTIDVAVPGRTERVRLIGIDTPEVGECRAKEATAELASLILGKRVRLESDRSQGSRDRYGRLLRYVRMTPHGTNVNERLVAWGYAREYTYDDPYRYQGAFKAAERAARAAGKGLWGACPRKPAPAPVVAAADKDCKDFPTQPAAQAYFDRRGGTRTNNVDGLDGDGDGVACEWLLRR